MEREINCYTKIILLCLMVIFLSITLDAVAIIKNVPARNIYFTGRLAYLDEMQKKFSQYKTIYLVGYSGVGKTQLAREYSYVNEQKYDLIWCFDVNQNLAPQYESLLNHLRDSEKFKNLLPNNVNNITPSIIIDVTNLLLSKCNCNWLLIFDNLANNQDIKLPETKTTGQHAIIITKEKQRFFMDSNVLTIGPFTDQESEIFLSKVYPSVSKEEITKIYKALHNYPLALAQASSFLKKHDKFTVEKHNDNYHQVLNLVLQDIEEKDQEASKVLYFLALLKIDVTKELLKGLFGDNIEEKLMILSKYGVVQTVTFKDRKIFNIHDIIKEEAIKRLNSKAVAYKKEIICTLAKYFNNFYSEKNFQYLINLVADDKQMEVLCAFIDVILDNDVVNDDAINVVIIALKLNNPLLNGKANYILYQRLANKIYHKNMNNITDSNKALLYANLIFSDFIFASEKNLLKFEQEILYAIKSVESHHDYEELFFSYAYMARFYLLLGDAKEAKKYLEKAEKFLNYVNNYFDLVAYWYINTSLFYELKDINRGIVALNNYERLHSQLPTDILSKLITKSFKIEFELLLGKENVAKKEIEEALKDASIYYHNSPSCLICKLEFLKALIYFQSGSYDLSKKQCDYVLDLIKKNLYEDILSSISVRVHLLMGKIDEKQAKYESAVTEYKKAFKYYHKKNHGRAIDLYNYGELLADLSNAYYKLKNIAESKFYFQKLAANFGLNNVIMGNLIKELPQEYMHLSFKTGIDSFPKDSSVGH